jgi:uncharacterized protein YdeI (YjbR/CyaY-like superfamily)
MGMEITETLYVPDRDAWRVLLTENHMVAKEIWLIYPRKQNGRPCIPYDDAVEEALCFGWIDGIQKSLDADASAQRFTPRKAKSNWSELNKERARRLIAAGKMTDAGFATLPDLSLDAFVIPDDILSALQADPQAWANFQQFSEVYQRIRIGYINEVRKQPAVFQQRLAHFLKMTAQNKTFGTLR